MKVESKSMRPMLHKSALEYGKVYRTDNYQKDHWLITKHGAVRLEDAHYVEYAALPTACIYVEVNAKVVIE